MSQRAAVQVAPPQQGQVIVGEQVPATPTAQGADGTVPASNRVSTSLYVGDLHPDVTEALLVDVFSQVGPVSSVRICRDSISRRSLTYGYVNFHFPADAERALDTLNYTNIKGKPCRIMWRHPDPTIRKGGVGNIFIKNLDRQIDNRALYDTFSAFGNILSCKVAIDENGKSKGFGFVHFGTREAAEAAIERVNGMLLNGKKVFVGLFQTRKERHQDGDEIFTNVYIKNLDPAVTQDELNELFAKHGEVTSCVVMTCARRDLPNRVRRERAMEQAKDELKKAGEDLSILDKERRIRRDAAVSGGNGDKAAEELSAEERKKVDELRDQIEAKTRSIMESEDPEEIVSKGFGFVNFKDREAAAAATAAINGTIVGNRRIYAGRAQKRQERSQELRQKFEAQREERLNKYQGINLYVKNLDDNVDDEKLRKAFSEYGTITSAKVMTAANGTSRGFGFVCYTTPEEATKAVTEMNGKMLGAKPVFVALAQRKEVRRQQLEAQYTRTRMGAPMGNFPSANPMYGGGPMFYPQMAMPQQRGGAGFVYTQAGVPRGGPGGPWQQGQPQRGGFQQGPGGPGNYGGNQQMYGGGQGGAGGAQRQMRRGNNQNPRGGNPQQGNNQRGGPNQRRPNQGQGQMQGQVPQAQGFQGQAGFQFAPSARNAQNAQQGGAPQQASSQQAQQVQQPASSDVLTATALAAATPENQKNMLGERLFPMIRAVYPESAGKITGMLLEMEPGEVLHLIENQDALRAKMAEAVAVLQAHSLQAPQ